MKKFEIALNTSFADDGRDAYYVIEAATESEALQEAYKRYGIPEGHVAMDQSIIDVTNGDPFAALHDFD